MRERPGPGRAAGRARRQPLSPQEQLFAACMRGDWPEAARALDRGADLSAPVMAVPLKVERCWGLTQYRPNLLLHAVVLAGDVPVTAGLLWRGADPGRADSAGRTALHSLATARRLGAQRTGRLARLLSAAGAQVDQTDRDGRSACHLAAAVGNTAALAALAQLGADCGRVDSAGDSPLHAAVQAGSGQTALLALLLSPASLRRRNAAGQTPLALASSPDTARQLLAAGAEVDAATLLALLRHAPDAVPDALDSCVTTNSLPIDSTQLEVSIDFSAFCGTASTAEDRLLAAIAASGQHRLFKHHAVEPFLHAKWCRVRHLFYANLVLCAALTLLISGYCWARLQRPGGPAEVALAVTVAPPAVAMAARELFQVVHSPRQYVRSLENWVEMLLLVLIAVLLLGPRGDAVGYLSASSPNEVIRGTGNWSGAPAGQAGNGTDSRIALVTTPAAETLPWIEHTIAWTLPTAWLELTLMLSHCPNFGVYINMFVSAARQLALFVLILTPLVIGFALGFHVLLGDPSGGGSGGPFDSLPVSHITTTMMMVGEYNYDDVFLGSGFGASAGLLLALFIALMSTMSMNLLIGLTVADTRGVFRAAKLQSLRHTATQILQVETVLRSTLLRVLLPNRLLRREQHRAAVLPLLCRAPNSSSSATGGGGGGGWCRFTRGRGEVTLGLRQPVMAPAEQTGLISDVSPAPAVFRPNCPRERRTIYRCCDPATGGGGGRDSVLLPSGLQTRGWMQRGLLTLLRRRQQQPADRQHERLLDALLSELSRPHSATDEELVVLGRAAGRSAEAGAVPPPSPAASRPATTAAEQTQSAARPTSPTDGMPRDGTSMDGGALAGTTVSDGGVARALPHRRLPATQRTRKTGDSSSTGDRAWTRAGGAEQTAAEALPLRRPGRAERRRKRWRKEAAAQQDAAVALGQKLNTVLATVSQLSLKLDTVQRRLTVGGTLPGPGHRGRT